MILYFIIEMNRSGIGKEIMHLSKTRLSDIESLPEDAIDTSEIPELDNDFWENANRLVPEHYLQIEHEILYQH